ncbi:hypothetical protein M405DRAFT_634490 [Rhizopogon salebrosus TDB-379]|nr:hypothetical protein M405DRAFT_634490 [Rhizopogon salebrosus TDB-379]
MMKCPNRRNGVALSPPPRLALPNPKILHKANHYTPEVTHDNSLQAIPSRSYAVLAYAICPLFPCASQSLHSPSPKVNSPRSNQILGKEPVALLSDSLPSKHGMCDVTCMRNVFSDGTASDLAGNANGRGAVVNLNDDATGVRDDGTLDMVTDADGEGDEQLDQALTTIRSLYSTKIPLLQTPP